MSRPPKHLAGEPGRAQALARLYAVIGESIEDGQAIPCMSSPSLWLSERKADQEAAGWRCMTCPAIAACRDYVVAHPEPTAVWASMPPAQRSRPSQQDTRRTA